MKILHLVITAGIGMALVLVWNPGLSYAQQDGVVLGGQKTYPIYEPPLGQVKSGTLPIDVTCYGGLHLVFKAEDGSPACIHQATIPKLVLRGWVSTTKLQDNTISGDFYPGIENNAGTASLGNKSYYIMTLSNQIYAGEAVQFHSIIFSFPYGWLVTPGGGLLPVSMTFPDGVTESFGYSKRNPDGSGALSGLSLGPGPSSNRTVTILSSHVNPQAGVTLSEDNVKLLVSSEMNSSGLPEPDNPLGITALVIYHPFLACLGPCPPNNFYLKINSNSSAYLFGYDVCDDQSCVRNDTLSVPLPLNSPLKPEYAQVWLPQDIKWHDGDTVHLQVMVSSLPDNRTATTLDLGNSTIVP